MAGELAGSQPTESFEFMLLDRDTDQMTPVLFTPNKVTPWIDSSKLKLRHRIGRGPFGDVWLATHHLRCEGHEQYHEVALKMLYPIKDDQMQSFLAKFDEVISKCQGLENVCLLHGISLYSGRICIAMKFYEGSIGDIMTRKKGGKLALCDVLSYGVKLVQAVIELHRRGIMVLNLKPCNFLLDENEQPVLGDFGIPFLLLGLSSPSSDLVQRFGTPNYMAPEQWEASIRGPVSFETDSWALGCSIVEMLSGIQPWRGKSSEEIYQLVVVKKQKPNIPNSLPPEFEDILHGCFEYDLRNRPSFADILQVFKSCKGVLCQSNDANYMSSEKSSHFSYINLGTLKDQLQIGDVVRSRKPNSSCKPVNMEIPEGTVVGMSTDGDEDGDGYILVRVYGLHQPLRVHHSAVERVTYGFVAGDWVRLRQENKKYSPVGILHSIDRNGRVTGGFIGMEKLWSGHYLDLQMAESFCVGHFLKLKPTICSPRFKWPCKHGGVWATGRISQILPNGCIVVKFPGRFTLGEADSCLADPSEVEMVSFKTCDSIIKKYEHIEDYHWAVRPLVIGFGLFTTLKLGLFIGGSVGKATKKNFVNISRLDEQQKRNENVGNISGQEQQDWQNDSNPKWLLPPVTNMLFGEGVAAR